MTGGKLTAPLCRAGAAAVNRSQVVNRSQGVNRRTAAVLR